MLNFKRQKNVTVQQIDDRLLEIRAALEDNFHNINTVIVVDTGKMQIEKAHAEMVMIPFDLCREVCGKMDGLVGLKLSKGISRWVKEVVGTSRGCAHLVDLVIDSVKAVIQVMDFYLLPEDLPFDEKLQRIQSANLGICHTYSNLGRGPKYIGNRDI